jgi:hypothetical protein
VKNLGQFGKATFATVTTFLGSLVTVMVGDVGFGDLTDGQWLAAILFGLVAGGGVYGIKYVPAGSSTP